MQISSVWPDQIFEQVSPATPSGTPCTHAQSILNFNNATKMAIRKEDARLKQQVTDRHLSEIAAEIIDWEALAPYLSLKEAEIEEIKQDFSTSKKQKVGLLRVWRERYGDEATYQCLIQAARDSHNAKLASHINELLGK